MICSICGQRYEGYGNNAWPINEGRCCDSCNTLVVLKRMERHLTEREQAVMHRALRRSTRPA